jgi:transglutaminase/protease-like cytokinesis protein 3
LNQIQKSYILFLWICDNISYDAISYYSGLNVDCTPERTFISGKSICSGYSRLYKNIALYLNLEVECVCCYVKGASYKVGQKMNKTNHEYNVPIESTWGSGYIDGKNFQKKFNGNYFLLNPELLILSHFPKDDKWQLTKEKYTLKEFEYWPKIELKFYEFGFKSIEPKKGLIELKNCNKQKFIIYGDNMNKKSASCQIN